MGFDEALTTETEAPRAEEMEAPHTEDVDAPHTEEADAPDAPDGEPEPMPVEDEHGATYAIGDVQGCFDDLLRLLDRIDFDPAVDRIWLTGDLVNRGPNSLALLRFVRSLGSAAVSVLGNHDLNLLGAAAGTVDLRKKDTIAEILDAPDCEELLFWLRHQPLLHHDEKLGFTMVHAGFPPQWDLAMAKACAAELELVLQNFRYEDFFAHMGLGKPLRWRPDLAGWERLRFIANCFTQLRWCDRDGRLDLTGSRRRARGKRRSLAWFDVPDRASRGQPILFGHWATLNRKGLEKLHVYPLDTGCANNGRFTALRLQDGKYYRVRCKNESVPWSDG